MDCMPSNIYVLWCFILIIACFYLVLACRLILVYASACTYTRISFIRTVLVLSLKRFHLYTRREILVYPDTLDHVDHQDPPDSPFS